MKIHYLVTSLESGGAEFAMPQILQTFLRHGHQVELTACEPRDMMAARRLEEAGLPYRVMFDRRRSKLTNVLGFLRVLQQTGRPDVIWTSLSLATYVGQAAGRLTGTPVVSWKHSASVKPYVYRTRQHIRLWVADCDGTARFLRDDMQIPPGQVMTWPLFSCAITRHQRPAWNTGRCLQIGSVGRLHEVKNYPLLIQGIALFRSRYPQYAGQVRLSILGEGPQRLELESLVSRLGLEAVVALPGYSANVQHFLAGLDVYAQPSRYEGMCLAVHEAMGSGLPAMATAVGEMARSVQDGRTGFILRGDIPQAVCDTLARIFARPGCLTEYGAAARAHIQAHYSAEAFDRAGAAILEQISQRILKRPG